MFPGVLGYKVSEGVFLQVTVTNARISEVEINQEGSEDNGGN